MPKVDPLETKYGGRFAWASKYRKRAEDKRKYRFLRQSEVTVEALAEILHEAGRETAMHGGVVNRVRCPTCRGRGYDINTSKTCEKCAGTGTPRFLGWDEVSDAVRMARRITASFLTHYFHVFKRDDPDGRWWESDAIESLLISQEGNQPGHEPQEDNTTISEPQEGDAHGKENQDQDR